MKDFNLRKYLAENKLIKEEMSLEIDDDFIELTADSGTYDAYIEDDGTVDFSVTYEDEDDRDGEEFDEDNWKDILGPNHAFVKISNQIPTKVEAVDDYVMITVDVEDLKGISDLAEGKLLKENIQDEDLIASQAIDMLDEFRVYAESEDLIQYLNKSMDYLERIPSNDDVYSAIQAVADGLNPYTGEEFDYTVDEMQSELERLIS
jgi:hypothetical protein